MLHIQFECGCAWLTTDGIALVLCPDHEEEQVEAEYERLRQVGSPYRLLYGPGTRV